jgi:hypothetical protein
VEAYRSDGEVRASNVPQSNHAGAARWTRHRDDALRVGSSTVNSDLERERVVIRTAETKIVAEALRERYKPARAVSLIGRVIGKAVFTGRSDEVVFWALVHAHYRGGDLCPTTEEQLNMFARFFITDPSES